jgi:hypothetical protein
LDELNAGQKEFKDVLVKAQQQLSERLLELRVDRDGSKVELRDINDIDEFL